jgi:NADH-quinone oxidoreductase subunit G
MLKQGGEWKEVDWQTALEYVAHGLKNIKHEHGANALAALATPHSTLEELHLLQKLTRAWVRTASTSACVSDFALDPMAGHVDRRIRPAEPRLRDRFVPAQGSPAAGDASASAKGGAKLSILHATDDDLLMNVANKMIAAPSDWLAALSQVVVAVAEAKEIAAPAGFEGVQATPLRDRCFAAVGRAQGRVAG